MRTPSLGLAPEGGPIIGLLALTALVAACLDWWPLALPALVLLWLAVHFFRDPERVVPHGGDLAVSPADGKVIRIAERADPFTGEPRVCVSVFMNLFSVHINRSPAAGRVTDIRYTPGRFFNAAWDKASTDNERCAWQLTDAGGAAWTFVQIAGLVARRIVPWAEVGDELARGQRFGLIRFGSRVDLYLPEGYDSAVDIGQSVLAGQTVIARRASCGGKD
ncbi:MAG: phosphatidylserine decarboxylase family protein [Desulfovibrionaceae bacterium]|nr:phosphatidylserine decarboxylase family protein [Desulfovibrionaceae bacterium]